LRKDEQLGTPAWEMPFRLNIQVNYD
jgi:hypothetical protein